MNSFHKLDISVNDVLVRLHSSKDLYTEDGQ
jgi:hypothetical protein